MPIAPSRLRLALLAAARAESPAARRRRALLGLTVAVSLLHLSLLMGSRWSQLGQSLAPQQRAPVQLRLLPAPNEAPAHSQASAEPPVARLAHPAPAPPRAAATQPQPNRTEAQQNLPQGARWVNTREFPLGRFADPTPAAQTAAAPAEPTPEPPPQPPAPEPQTPADSATPSAGPVLRAISETRTVSNNIPPTPVYAVNLPDPVLLNLRVQRGPTVGQGTLRWERSSDGSVRASLLAQTLGRPEIDWVSTGTVDAAGLAPDRLVESRRGRAVRAVNFQRDKGLISFSGPSETGVLHPGAQDRLSWLMQLAGVAQARGESLRPGEELVFQVAAPAGDVDAWTFVAGQRVKVVLGDKTVLALPLVREPTRPYDSRVSVWLACDYQCLPLRIRFEPLPQGEPLELTLTELPRLNPANPPP